MKRLAVVLIALALTFSALASPPPVRVILVRHAEKLTDPALTDPDLTPAGKERARELVRVFRELRAGTRTAILVTQFARTQQTAAPLAAALHVTPVVIRTGATYVADVVARIRQQPAGATVIVVGHSNTTPDVLRTLGIADPPAIPDSEFDDLFIVTLTPNGAPRLVALRYGAVAR
jgi:broad specificity phosphatase PhoE